ncbi:hypothetical protein LIER_26676 [Lithospermum erythrorhizon]|uniref:Uncharacterized protein n=1 Tax=Lithospermum erythrorhizon TaxID=34254 RepID=A0AAV3RCL9_LITER
MSTTPYSPMVVTEQARPFHPRNGSVGPVIGVLAVIAVLGAAAVMIGRLCSSGRRIMGHGQYDFESWVEMKCASCIDGHVSSIHHPAPPPLPRVVVSESSSSTTRGSDEGEAMAADVEETTQERKEEGMTSQEQENQQQHHQVDVH